MVIIRQMNWVYFASVVVVLMLFSENYSYSQPTVPFSPDMLAIQGKWVRTDAPYVIELRSSPDNMLKASYFNPQPIHVESTEARSKGGILHVLITLQDVDYPGSKYLLGYDRKYDFLKGIYILGASGERFEVSFTRKKTQ
jgi:hypothetical protein